MTGKTSLKELVEGACQGAPDALDMLRQRYRPRLAALVASLLPPPLEARGGVEAVVQAVDDLVPKRLADFQWQSDDHFDGWLLGLAREHIVVQLLEMYRPRILGAIRGKLPDYLRREGAEDDIWQQTCVVALEQFTGWEDEDRFVSWLKTIAANQIKDRLKWDHRFKRDIARRVSNYPGNDREGSRPGIVEQNAVDRDRPSKIARRAERVRIMLDTMATILTEREQMALRLRYLESKSVSETAEIMESKVSAVKMTCKRAMEKIRRQLGDSFDASSGR